MMGFSGICRGPVLLSSFLLTTNMATSSITMTPTSIPSKLPTRAPSEAPSDAPTYVDFCEDSLNATFFVDEQRGDRGCVWLAKKPEWQTTLCVPGHDAYEICEETCGKCTDRCNDAVDQYFWVNNVQRYKECQWLSVSPGWHATLCQDGHEAYELCRDTCNSCHVLGLSPTATPTQLPSISPTQTPSHSPSKSPSRPPSISPTFTPTHAPSTTPTQPPSLAPTTMPSSSPTFAPSRTPTLAPTASPTQPPSESPSNAPVYIDTCDDLLNETFFVDEARGDKGCIWLAKKPEWQPTLCVDGHEAYDICEETCGKCTDTCHDNVGHEFWVNNVQRYKDCQWLSVSPGWRLELCHSGHEAYELCRETCDNCLPPGLAPTSSPTQSPSVIPSEIPSMIPSTSPTWASTSPSQTPSIAPSEEPTLVDFCDDNFNATFFVDEARGDRGCVWLAKKPSWQLTLCVPDHDAYHICEETCGKCTDTCEDASDLVFWVNNVQRFRNCSWLAVSPGWHPALCQSGHEAYELCQDTCNNCG